MAQYDVVIIGGGIHGVGVAQAAAAAGHSVLVLEQSQLASGSSSRSSKLIHGGLRYLESAQFSLVYECLHERQRLLKLAPELVRLEAFHIPVYAQTHRRPWQLRSGLSLYALLGGLHRSSLFKQLGNAEWSQLDGLQQQDLQTVYRYYDGMSDDAALTRAVMNSAISLGAELELPARFTAASLEADRVSVRYLHGTEERDLEAQVLVNASGPWVNEVMQSIAPAQTSPAIDWVQGSHLVLDTKIQAGSYYLEADDGRAVFVLPWKGKTMLGTTETQYTGRPEAVSVLPQERDYLLAVLERYFPHLQGVPILEEYAGLRVLPKAEGSHFSRPRDTRIIRSHPRLVSIYGGKLTTYRLTAEKLIRQLDDILETKKRITTTDRLMLTPI